MKYFQVILIIGLLLTSVFMGAVHVASHSRWWVCEFCGHRVNAVNMPGVQYCNKNPWGNTHRWRAMD
jgi:hypothetical protein